MFIGFHSMLRTAGLKIGLTEWLALMEALDAGLVEPSLRSFYDVSRALVCRDEGDYDRFDQAFAAYFSEAELPPKLKDKLAEWLSRPIERPALSDEELEKLQSLDLDELRKLFEERMAEQDERHDGGDYWIGSGGKSPFGQGGQHPTGMRVGEGAKGRGSAVAAARARRFRNYRDDRVLDTRALAVAIRRLRRLERKARRMELDIDETVRKTARTDLLEIVERPERRNQARVVLMMDSGGSMEPHTRLVEQFFSAMKKSGGLREVETYYFHNCVYNKVYTDIAQFESKDLDEICRGVPPNTHLFFVGDAWMGPYELLAPYGSLEMATSDKVPGIDRLAQLAAAYPKRVWLNPIPENYWHAETIAQVREVVDMYPMTVAGIVEAVSALLGRGANRDQREPIAMWSNDALH
ncbi:MAG: VWA domain-containing protein [Myxococcales bacterium]|nr:VWA domain-containing protein [Myxococcales bacterium]